MVNAFSKGILYFFVFTFLIACGEINEGDVTSKDEATLQIDYEKYTLSNGLDIILHEDFSNPIVAVATIVHVGSTREKIGKTGFAHLFEHMILQKTENIPEHFGTLMNKWAGRADGYTGTDATNYYELVPSDALEKVLWLESDRMGFFINGIKSADLEAEKPIVKNEKRMRVDNIPYGYNSQVIKEALYPKGHPMSWPSIGKMEDIDNASIEEIKNFHKKYYGPNNSTVVIAGDFDKKQVKEWIDKYFGEIPSRGEIVKKTPEKINLKESVSLYHEDAFAQLPQLTISWPTVPLNHPDALKLDMLATLLTDEISGAVYKEVVNNKIGLPL